MSTTYSFVCDDCRKQIWAGQSFYIYKYDHVADFLHSHLGHKIAFLSDAGEDERLEDYEIVDKDSDGKYLHEDKKEDL